MCFENPGARFLHIWLTVKIKPQCCYVIWIGQSGVFPKKASQFDHALKLDWSLEGSGRGPYMGDVFSQIMVSCPKWLVHICWNTKWRKRAIWKNYQNLWRRTKWFKSSWRRMHPLSVFFWDRRVVTGHHGPLISLIKNRHYCYVLHSSKHTDTCKWSGHGVAEYRVFIIPFNSNASIKPKENICYRKQRTQRQ